MNSKVKKTDVESGDSSSSYGSLGGSLNRDSDTESTSKTFLERQRKDITYIAEKKTFWKGVFVYIVLAVAAAGTGFATYFLIHTSQLNEFEAQFESYARETADIAENNAESTFGQLKTLATTITSLTIDRRSNETFPNVTVPHFDLRAQEVAQLTGIEMLMFVPFVEQRDRHSWEQYSNANQWWIKQDYEYRNWNLDDIVSIPQEIYSLPWFNELNDTRPGYSNADGFMENIMTNLTYDSEGFSAPIAQFGPAPANTSLTKLDLFAHHIFKKEIVASLEYDVPVISEPTDLSFLLDYIDHVRTPQLHSFTLDQVKDDFRDSSKTIGYIVGIVPWSTFFKKLLPEDVNGIVVTIESDCGSTFTYIVNGGKGDIFGEGDLHSEKYDNMQLRKRFFWKDHPTGSSRHCHFDLVIYPSEEFQSAYTSRAPILFGGAVAMAFVFFASIFFVFNLLATARQMKVQEKANRAEAIVASVFPKTIGERLIAEAKGSSEKSSSMERSSHRMLQNHVVFGEKKQEVSSKPIADLFPDSSILFGDIVGFTAWSSTREPSQVFILLETLYKEFDRLAKRRGVYKVETVGDCWVGVAGLPEPRRDHFVAVSRFAVDMLNRMAVTTSRLESELGPDTGDLGIRIGIHSGPVTAGVLRGERARFQLFGDAVNTAARLESTGQKNRIHVSKETADLLENDGKAHWLTKRDGKVVAKGKGELETYWLRNIRGDERQSSSSSGSAVSKAASLDEIGGPCSFSAQWSARVNTPLNAGNSNKKFERLINWNMDILGNLLKKILLSRTAANVKPESEDYMNQVEKEIQNRQPDATLIDEVVETVSLPYYKECTQSEAALVELSPEVQTQLHDFILTIAYMYKENSFHNFEHASHVTMSVTKLLGRIVAPDIYFEDEKDLHDRTYGITSDPLTQFAIVFSSLIHDVDHPGIPNTQLVKEGAEVAELYKNKSIAEQNSIDLAWDLLMEENFRDLRRAIYTTADDLQRFRKLIVNIVMATDIMDPLLKQLRNARWKKTFSLQNAEDQAPLKEKVDRKATIVIEHLIQASDVAHTMQHWQVYRKWNAKLFLEMYDAFREGRSEKDPSEFWYEGEIGFFDFYIIPLAKKLQECGVFGVSSHEYLGYALQNKEEWVSKGEEIVAELKNLAESKAP